MVLNDPEHFKEQSSCFVKKAPFLPSYTVRLAGEPSRQDVKTRDIRSIDVVHVSYQGLIVSEISQVSFLGLTIDLRSHNAFGAQRLKSISEPTDACEKLYKFNLSLM